MNRCALAIFTMMAAFAAHAQLLPPVQVPPVRAPELPRIDRTLDKTVADITSIVDPRELIDLRRDRVRDLLRTQRRFVERDPQGAPIVRAEVVAFDPSDEALTRARAAGFAVVREQVLEGLGAKTVVLQAPRGMPTRKALQKLKELDATGTYDFNHIYLDSGIVDQNPAAHALSSGGRGRGEGRSSSRVGLIDGGVDITHPVFTNNPPHLYGCGGKAVASAHGTAVASLLTGNTEKFAGSLPGADLYAADVYCGAPAGGAVDAISNAFAWLVRERVPVINVSLVGPPNATLERVIRLVIGRGHIVVAAVGNDGPNAPPLYPAAYAGVVGVTGVDNKRRVLLEALRGEQVDFAAAGADLAAAGKAHAFGAVRGTSFAAPIVAGLLAAALFEPDAKAAATALEKLAAGALDLGERGRDPVYGEGLVSVTH